MVAVVVAVVGVDNEAQSIKEGHSVNSSRPSVKKKVGDIAIPRRASVPGRLSVPGRVSVPGLRARLRYWRCCGRYLSTTSLSLLMSVPLLPIVNIADD